MPLKERVYKCPNCKASLDRDLNASINLANFGSTASFVETCKNKACREVQPIESTTLKTSTKQEVSFKPIQLSLFDLIE